MTPEQIVRKACLIHGIRPEKFHGRGNSKARVYACVKLYEMKYTRQQIAYYVGFATGPCVTRTLKEAGITARKERKAKSRIAKNLHDRGVALGEIARTFGLCDATSARNLINQVKRT